MGEPQLGRRGLYHNTGGTNPKEREYAMLWLLNQADGRHSLLEVAERSHLDIMLLRDVAEELQQAGLLVEAGDRRRG
jgi:aminopeptidase-like protein